MINFNIFELIRSMSLTAFVLGALTISPLASATETITVVITDFPAEAWRTANSPDAENILLKRPDGTKISLKMAQTLCNQAAGVVPRETLHQPDTSSCKKAGAGLTLPPLPVSVAKEIVPDSWKIYVDPYCVGNFVARGTDDKQKRLTEAVRAIFTAINFKPFSEYPTQSRTNDDERKFRIGATVDVGITRTSPDIDIFTIPSMVALYEFVRISHGGNYEKEQFLNDYDISNSFLQATVGAQFQVSYGLLFVRGRIETSPTSTDSVTDLSSFLAFTVAAGVQTPPFLIGKRDDLGNSRLTARGALWAGLAVDKGWDRTVVALVGDENARKAMDNFFGPKRPLDGRGAYVIGGDVSFALSGKARIQPDDTYNNTELEYQIKLTLGGQHHVYSTALVKAGSWLGVSDPIKASQNRAWARFAVTLLF